MNVVMSTTAVVLGLGVLFVAGQAGATGMTRNFVQNATGTCQSSLPVFDGQICKRTLAIQNEDRIGAFVTCSFMDTDRSMAGVKAVSLYADNGGVVDVPMTCTLVTGVCGSMDPEFIVKTLILPDNSNLNEFLWMAADRGGMNFNNFTTNVSCLLPVDTGLTASFVYYDEDTGN